jgi:hypothetical protein
MVTVAVVLEKNTDMAVLRLLLLFVAPTLIFFHLFCLLFSSRTSQRGICVCDPSVCMLWVLTHVHVSLCIYKEGYMSPLLLFSLTYLFSLLSVVDC